MEVKTTSVQSKKGKSVKSKHARGEGKPIKGENKLIRGNAGLITRVVDERLELMEFDD